MGGVIWRNGGFAAHAILGQSEAIDSPIAPPKICRLDKDAVFG
tara:strand:- start:396 stop:524 length:129 start_codon:yes stop_codon:yes gene_type:complete